LEGLNYPGKIFGMDSDPLWEIGKWKGRFAGCKRFFSEAGSNKNHLLDLFLTVNDGDF
jgi:hypothetical protein